MIRMTRLTDYGIVLLTHFARQDGRDPRSAREIAAASHLPRPTVSKVLKLLARKGLLTAQRGVKGGFALSRAAARQLVRHRHVTVDNRVVDIPSYQVSPNALVAIRQQSRDLAMVKDAVEKRGGRTLPGWLEVNMDAMNGRIRMKPAREEIQIPVQEQLIVELYSK